jgi:PhzF family phenazine biosynthesis protein
MNLKVYQVDAFTDSLFNGNPAAVCPLETWLADDLLQNIALENNVSETAYYGTAGDFYEIRWFTPTVEVDLCGHATLATAYVLFNHENFSGNKITFKTLRSGDLTVTRDRNLITLNFPVDPPLPVKLCKQINECFNTRPLLAFRGRTDYLLIYDNEDEIRLLQPRLANIKDLDCRGVIVTAPGQLSDFVSRFFGPQSGVDEDPVTGSAHTTLMPYWSDRLGKKELTAIQLSARKGYLKCKMNGDRVEISGHCKLFLTGHIILD